MYPGRAPLLGSTIAAKGEVMTMRFTCGAWGADGGENVDVAFDGGVEEVGLVVFDLHDEGEGGVN